MRTARERLTQLTWCFSEEYRHLLLDFQDIMDKEQADAYIAENYVEGEHTPATVTDDNYSDFELIQVWGEISKKPLGYVRVEMIKERLEQ